MLLLVAPVCEVPVLPPPEGVVGSSLSGWAVEPAPLTVAFSAILRVEEPLVSVRVPLKVPAEALLKMSWS